MTEIKTEIELRQAISGEKTAAICFHSPRSAYSRRMVARLATAERDFSNVDFHVVDADREAFLPLLLEFGVVGLPTLIIFRSGVRVKFLVGEHGEKAVAKHFGNWFGNVQPGQVLKKPARAVRKK